MCGIISWGCIGAIVAYTCVVLIVDRGLMKNQIQQSVDFHVSKKDAALDTMIEDQRKKSDDVDQRWKNLQDLHEAKLDQAAKFSLSLEKAWKSLAIVNRPSEVQFFPTNAELKYIVSYDIEYQSAIDMLRNLSQIAAEFHAEELSDWFDDLKETLNEFKEEETLQLASDAYLEDSGLVCPLNPLVAVDTCCNETQRIVSPVVDPEYIFKYITQNSEDIAAIEFLHLGQNGDLPAQSLTVKLFANGFQVNSGVLMSYEENELFLERLKQGRLPTTSFINTSGGDVILKIVDRTSEEHQCKVKTDEEVLKEFIAKYSVIEYSILALLLLCSTVALIALYSRSMTIAKLRHARVQLNDLHQNGTAAIQHALAPLVEIANR